MLMGDAAQAIVALGVCATVTITVVTIARAYVRGIEAQKKPLPPDLAPDVQDRMSRIEQAMDAIAIEVERMSEGQRFTTRLLAERFADRGDGVASAQGQPTARHTGGEEINRTGGRHVG